MRNKNGLIWGVLINLSNISVLMQGLLNKIILYRFTRNLDKELRDLPVGQLDKVLAKRANQILCNKCMYC